MPDQMPVSRPVDTREIPDGYHLEAVPEAIGRWRVAAGKPCRYARQGRNQCGEPSAALTRQRRSEIARKGARVRWATDPAPGGDSDERTYSLAQASAELDRTRREIGLLHRKERALSRLVDGMTALAEADAAHLPANSQPGQDLEVPGA